MIKEGKILKALSGFYYVQCQEELITCRARGNFRNDNITPLVGDDVKIKISDNNTGYVVEILERKNELLRPKVSNIDYSIIIVSVKEPDFSSKLLNKLICLNENSHVDIIIIFTKLDLLSKEELDNIKTIMDYYKKIGYIVLSNTKEDIQYLFTEFNSYDCKFKPCNHIEEVKCGVKEAVATGDVLESRYEDYKLLFKEKETQKKKYIKEK